MEKVKLSKVEQIMQNYRKSIEKIDAQYNYTDNTDNKYELKIKDLDEKIAYEKNFIEKLKDENQNEDLELINRAKERLEKALEEKQNLQKEKEDDEKAKREEKSRIEELKKSKVILPSGREVTMAEKNEIDKNHLRDEARRALTQESKKISEKLEEKNKELVANRAARAEFKYEYEKDENGKSTGKIINADVLVQNHKDFEKIREEMAELNKEQEACAKYLEEFRQMDNKKMENFAKTWNEVAKENNKQENSKSETKRSTVDNSTLDNLTHNNPVSNSTVPNSSKPNRPEININNLENQIIEETEQEENQGNGEQNQGETAENNEKQEIKIVIGRKLNIETGKNIIGIGNTGKLIKQDKEDISEKLQKIFKGESIEELNKIEEISKTVDPILLEGIIELKNKNILTENQIKNIIPKLANNDVKKEDLGFKIVYDMEDLSKGAFLPWNRKERNMIAKIAEKNREIGIAEFKDGKEFEPNPIKRMLAKIKIKQLNPGNEEKLVSKINFRQKIKNETQKSEFEQLRNEIFAENTREGLSKTFEKAKEATKAGKISTTELQSLMNSMKSAKTNFELKEKEKNAQNIENVTNNLRRQSEQYKKEYEWKNGNIVVKEHNENSETSKEDSIEEIDSER